MYSSVPKNNIKEPWVFWKHTTLNAFLLHFYVDAEDKKTQTNQARKNKLFHNRFGFEFFFFLRKNNISNTGRVFT